MGDIADMMLEGDLCESCGAALGGEGYGIPRYCSNECARDRGFDHKAADGTGRYGATKPRPSKEGQPFPKDVLSIKITYKGQKIFYATEFDTSFDQSAEIGSTFADILDKSYGIKPRFLHPKAVTEVIDLANTSPDTNNSSSNPPSQGDTT
jgi:hypothetical protein